MTPPAGPLAPTAPTHLLYLHGFRSSPQSFKARRLSEWLALNRPEVHWWCPQLPASPREAMALVFDGIRDWPRQGPAVLGSSLGGFYASAVAEATGWPVVLMNPAVSPARDLASWVGEQPQFHDPGQTLHFKPEHIAELQALTTQSLTQPERYLPLIAKGDEQLSWQEMSARYSGTRQRLIEGSDHGLSDFEEHLPHILRFLQLIPKPPCD